MPIANGQIDESTQIPEIPKRSTLRVLVISARFVTGAINVIFYAHTRRVRYSHFYFQRFIAISLYDDVVDVGSTRLIDIH